MNRANFKKYVSYVKDTKRTNIEDQYIEKAYEEFKNLLYNKLKKVCNIKV